MPQGGEFDADDWGGLGPLVTAPTVAQQRRLSDDERDAGFEPW